jgi:hypothetical protein
MKANELRIGNWILNKRYKSGYKMQIESIGEFGLNIELGHDGLNPLIGDDCSFNECEPIPLTDEWLVKFGFKEKNCGYLCKNKRIFISNSNYDFEYSCSFFDCDDYIEIKYVHQLQNIYFALTNEEL